MSNIVIVEKHLDAIPHTTEGLRDALFDEINALRDGTASIQRARVLCSLADKIIESIRIQIQHNKVLIEAAKSEKQV